MENTWNPWKTLGENALENVFIFWLPWKEKYGMLSLSDTSYVCKSYIPAFRHRVQRYARERIYLTIEAPFLLYAAFYSMLRYMYIGKCFRLGA